MKFVTEDHIRRYRVFGIGREEVMKEPRIKQTTEFYLIP